MSPDAVETELRELQDMFAPEELHPDLARAYKEDPFPMIHHPLHVSVIHGPHMNKMANKAYAWKKDQIAKCIKEENWPSYIMLHERAYRTDALVRVFTRHEVPTRGRIAGELVADVWTDQENPHVDLEFWFNAFNALTPDDLMDSQYGDGYQRWKDLPDEFTIFRGSDHEPVENGIAWTLSEEKAEWFANRFDRKGRVASRNAKKYHTRALFTGRGEDEVIYSPLFTPL